MKKMNRYCEECLTRTKQHCEGRDDDTASGDATTHDVQVMRADGSYELMPDYIQAGTSGNSNKPHGLNFCQNHQLDPAQLPRAKSAKAIRDEFNAQRAANKAATKAKKDAAKKLKVKARYDKKQKASAAGSGPVNKN